MFRAVRVESNRMKARVNRYVPLFLGLLAVSALGRYPFAVVDAQGPPQPALRLQAAQHAGVLNRYCVTCHNARLKTGGLVLDTGDLEHAGERPELWEKVVRKLRTGTMPPAGSPRPEPAAYDALASWLE